MSGLGISVGTWGLWEGVWGHWGNMEAPRGNRGTQSKEHFLEGPGVHKLSSNTPALSYNPMRWGGKLLLFSLFKESQTVWTGVCFSLHCPISDSSLHSEELLEVNEEHEHPSQQTSAQMVLRAQRHCCHCRAGPGRPFTCPFPKSGSLAFSSWPWCEPPCLPPNQPFLS